MVMKDPTPSMDKIRFTPDTLYATEREELVEFAQEQFAMLFDVVHLAKVSNSLGAKVTTIGKTTRATVYATSRIHATLSEVRDIFFSEHTQFATGFAQSQQIHALLTPSNKHPMRSAALRWSLWETPSKMVRKRDIVYVEYMDAFVTKDGRNGWARCTHSIEHRSCPALTHSHNIVRAHMYCSGTLYTETDEPGVLEVVTLFDVDTRGIPAWMSKMIALRKAQSAANVEHLIRLSRVMTDEDDPDVKMIEFHVKGKVCRGCGDRVSKWSSTRKCRKCKEPLCKSCSEVVYCYADERKKMKQICVYCVDDVIMDQEQRGDVSNLGLDAISEHYPHVPRRMHHMSFRSLRRTREINYSLSPSASERPSLSYASSRLSASTSHASLSRRRSDPGMSIQSFTRSHTTSSSLRSASSITA